MLVRGAQNLPVISSIKNAILSIAPRRIVVAIMR